MEYNLVYPSRIVTGSLCQTLKSLTDYFFITAFVK